MFNQLEGVDTGHLLAAGSVVVLLVLSLAVAGVNPASVVGGSGVGEGDYGGSSGNGSASLQFLTASVLADSCSEARETNTYSYDNCAVAEESGSGFVEARAILFYDDIDSIGTTDSGDIVVEPGEEVDYKCVDNPDYYSDVTKAWKLNDAGVSPDIDFGSGSSISAPYEQIPLQGSIDVSYSTPTELQIVCGSLSSDYQGNWAGVAKWIYWTSSIVEAEDSDGDGVYDVNDECPKAGDQGYGVKDNGCPIVDSDGDTVPDPEDDCPDTRGTVETSGCPDSDVDGVPDREDECPGTPSGVSVDGAGCPVDSDGDGVPDYQDMCPQRGDQGFGLKSNGCPVGDSDGDGVGNNVDQCSGTPEGVNVDSTGCAVDSDGDGVPDHVDQCPGTGNPKLGVNESGCAIQDDDSDGVVNSVDQCPSTYGSKTSGCPTVIDSIINVLGLRGVL